MRKNYHLKWEKWAKKAKKRAMIEIAARFKSNIL